MEIEDTGEIRQRKAMGQGPGMWVGEGGGALVVLAHWAEA